MITDDLKAASRNRENIARMRELENEKQRQATQGHRQGGVTARKNQTIKLSEVRPRDGKHQPPKKGEGHDVPGDL